MESLIAATKEVFSGESVLSGLSIKEAGSRFSIEKRPTEKAFAIDLRKIANWPSGTPRADAVFVCFPEGASHFLLVLVELKSSRKEHAIAQLSASCKTLCSGSQHADQFHNSLAAEDTVS